MLICFDVCSQAESCSAGKSRWNKVLGGCSTAELQHTSHCVSQLVIQVSVSLEPPWPGYGWQFYQPALYQRPTAEVFYILHLLMKSHFANQIEPSTDLSTMFDSYCNYRECLLAQNNHGELICLQSLSKHL